MKAIDYIRATTAFGGDEYGRYSDGYSYLNRIAFEEWITRQPKVSGLALYRGYTFNKDYWLDGMVEEGSRIGVDNMTQSLDIPAFTSNLIRASTYMNDFGEIGLSDTQKALFEVQTKGMFFVDVSEYSVYPKEKEYRCVRDTELRVEKIINKGGFIHVKCTEI